MSTYSKVNGNNQIDLAASSDVVHKSVKGSGPKVNAITTAGFYLTLSSI